MRRLDFSLVLYFSCILGICLASDRLLLLSETSNWLWENDAANNVSRITGNPSVINGSVFSNGALPETISYWWDRQTLITYGDFKLSPSETSARFYNATGLNFLGLRIVYSDAKVGRKSISVDLENIWITIAGPGGGESGVFRRYDALLSPTAVNDFAANPSSYGLPFGMVSLGSNAYHSMSTDPITSYPNGTSRLTRSEIPNLGTNYFGEMFLSQMGAPVVDPVGNFVYAPLFQAGEIRRFNPGDIFQHELFAVVQCPDCDYSKDGPWRLRIYDDGLLYIMMRFTDAAKPGCIQTVPLNSTNLPVVATMLITNASHCGSKLTDFAWLPGDGPLERKPVPNYVQTLGTKPAFLQPPALPPTNPPFGIPPVAAQTPFAVSQPFAAQTPFGVSQPFGPPSVTNPPSTAPVAASTAPVVSSTAPTTQAPSSSSSSTAGSDVGSIVGGVVGGVLGLAVIVAIIIVLVLRNKKVQNKKKKQQDDSETTKAQPASASGNYGSMSAPTETIVMREDAEAKSEWNINPAEIELGKMIGKGSFGHVYKGSWRGADVAIKVTQAKDKKAIEDFLREAELMKKLRPHKNVCQLFGVTTVEGELAVVMDYLFGGSLDDVLRQIAPPLNWHEQIVLARGIASGMIHLHAEKILHRDLAARNILLGADGTPKISDFGMSHVGAKQRGGDEFDETRIESNVGPIRWMAPESIREFIFSPKTDVFSYGVLLWEIMTSGKVPHGDIANLTEVAVRRRDECFVPTCPEDAPPILVSLCKKCWTADPDLRPLFKQIVKKIDKWLEEFPEIAEQEVRQNLKPKSKSQGKRVEETPGEQRSPKAKAKKPKAQETELEEVQPKRAKKGKKTGRAKRTKPKQASPDEN